MAVYETGERVTWSGTGTVITAQQFTEGQLLKGMLSNPNREVTYIQLDDGLFLAADTTDDEFGHELTPANPKYWPPQLGDLWQDDDGIWWRVVHFDMGYRKCLRLQSFDALGVVIRSFPWFNENNFKAVLLYRDGLELVD